MVLDVGAVVSDGKIRKNHGNSGNPPVVIRSVGICDITLTTDNIDDRIRKFGKVFLGKKVHGSVHREGSAVECDRGLYPLVSDRAQDKSLESSAGLSHGGGIVRIHRSEIFALGIGGLLFQPVEGTDIIKCVELFLVTSLSHRGSGAGLLLPLDILSGGGSGTVLNRLVLTAESLPVNSVGGPMSVR